MDGVPANYLGRIVSKENFRAFIYAPNGNKRLVRSWNEFEANMQSGVWFATSEDAKTSVAQPAVEEKPKTRQRKPKNPVGVLSEVEKLLDEDEPLIEEEFIDAGKEGLAFEVTDDFLPKGK